jgi:serine/threonine protein kinase/tetratricopeptide (TPR) repeat protein
MNSPSTWFNRRYRLDQAIGSGGMGVVYRAYDRLMGRHIALKRITLQPSFFLEDTGAPHSTRGATTPHVTLAHEFHTLSSLKHPNVITVLDYGFETPSAPDALPAIPQPYFTMELLDTPHPFTKAARALSFALQIDVIAQLLAALGYLHARGIVHRDLKPGNVLIVNNEGVPRVRLVDFGLSIERERWGAIQGGLAGTPAYLAPEVVSGAPPSPAADLYAVGVMLYETFAGHHPFAGDPLTFLRRLQHTPPDLDALLLSPALQAVIGRLLAKNPTERPADAHALIHELYAASNLALPATLLPARERFLGATRFIGRERELARLRAILDYDLKGDDPQRPRLWLISGESGVGKSRLLDEFRTFALVKGWNVVRGTAKADANSAFQLWLTPLRALLVQIPDLTPLEVSLLAALIPDIGTLTDVTPLPFAPVATADAEHRLYNVIASLLTRVSDPTLIILDDMQWAGASLTLLDHLLPILPNTRVTIIGAYRHDEAPDLLMRFPNAVDMHLSPLRHVEIAELSAALVGQNRLAPHLIDRLARETEGNAFLLVETMRLLADGERLERAREALHSLPIFGGAATLLQRRLGRVSGAARAWLRLAAVGGRTLDLAVLERAWGASQESLIAACIDTALLTYESGEGYRFSHDRLRDHLLSEQTPDEIRAHHRRYAAALEAEYGGNLMVAATLVAHWSAAGDPDGERRALPSAARRARALGDQAAARQLYERWLALTDDPREQIECCLIIARIIFETARTPADVRTAENTLMQAYETARAIDDIDQMVITLYTLGWMRRMQGRFEDLYRLKVEIDALSPRVSPRTIMYVIEGHAYMTYLHGRFQEAAALFDEGYAHAIAQHNLGVAGNFINWMGICAMAGGDFALAARRFHDAHTMLQDSGHLTYQIVNQLARGLHALISGDHAAAESHYRAALTLAETIQDVGRMILACNGLSAVAWFDADLARAELYAMRAVAYQARLSVTPHPITRLIGWAIALRRGDRAALGRIAAWRDDPASRWGDHEIVWMMARALEREGAFARAAVGQTMPILSA